MELINFKDLTWLMSNTLIMENKKSKSIEERDFLLQHVIKNLNKNNFKKEINEFKEESEDGVDAYGRFHPAKDVILNFSRSFFDKLSMKDISFVFGYLNTEIHQKLCDINSLEYIKEFTNWFKLKNNKHFFAHNVEINGEIKFNLDYDDLTNVINIFSIVKDVIAKNLDEIKNDKKLFNDILFFIGNFGIEKFDERNSIGTINNGLMVYKMMVISLFRDENNENILISFYKKHFLEALKNSAIASNFLVNRLKKLDFSNQSIEEIQGLFVHNDFGKSSSGRFIKVELNTEYVIKLINCNYDQSVEITKDIYSSIMSVLRKEFDVIDLIDSKDLIIYIKNEKDFEPIKNFTDNFFTNESLCALANIKSSKITVKDIVNKSYEYIKTRSMLDKNSNLNEKLSTEKINKIKI